jgi:hypothetical protein
MLFESLRKCACDLILKAYEISLMHVAYGGQPCTILGRQSSDSPWKYVDLDLPLKKSVPRTECVY